MTPSPNTCAEVGVCAAYVAHHARLAAFATSLVGDRELAQDLTVEAFSRLLSHWVSVQNPRPWLYATVANLAHDHWRSRRREAAAYERFQGALGGTDVAAPTSDLAVALSVRTAVSSLPARLRLPVLLYYFADESVADVAREVGRSPGAVKRDLHDARALLAASLGDSR